ncbi:hypothetical protein [Haladaptatus sp. DFWS20]|uniref:hypothetical protein n=1 Tax=Haladaptatus sp. DFWS20 TaxID=3403467 RepID=UPI003EBAB0D9
MNIQPLANESGIEIIDPIEKTRYVLHTPEPVSLTPVEAEGLDFPVEKAVELQTSAIIRQKGSYTFIRDDDFSVVFDSNEASAIERLPSDMYCVEVGGTPMKIYFSVTSSIVFEQSNSTSKFKFGSEQRVVVGARSRHKTPAGTISVTDDTEDVMQAMSLLGSSVKTGSPERSFPTLRGHPPLIERGDEFHVPESVEEPTTNATLVLPSKRKYLYPATPLAFYLGASIEAGNSPRLVVGDFEYDLLHHDTYERTVERVFQQAFFLDCLTRTNGLYPVTLHERELVKGNIDLDFESLYGASVSERLDEYLDVPFDALEPAMPTWHLAVDMVPATKNVELLPFLANSLALIRTANPPTTPKPMAEAAESMTDFYRETYSEPDFPPNGEQISSSHIFELAGETDTKEPAWVGPGYPLQWNKLTHASLYRSAVRSERFDATDSTIDIEIVCNDPSMENESDVIRYYDLRDLPQFDVSVHHRTTMAELVELLGTQSDFFHYIGHISDDGIRCVDGYLDAESLAEVNAKTFLPNACSSYEQGSTLIERGVVPRQRSLRSRKSATLLRRISAKHSSGCSVSDLRSELRCR